MSYVLSSPSATRRTGLIGIVVGLHIGLFALLILTKTALPQIVEAPLIVDLIEAMPLPQASRVKPSPVVTPPVPQKKESTPPQKAPQPVLETTASAEPAASHAPVVAAEAKPSVPSSAGGNSMTGDLPLVQARFDADYLKNPAPVYPSMSRRLGEEGKTILRVHVLLDGSADQVDIKTSSGSLRLDESAQRTVRTWKFVPAKRGGTPVESWVLVPITFRLEQ
ncbi:energy transducer TonB [Propionivibrio dicarboxylicus]|uniref:Outer membrane transport energization protein TonB n=1 Tax=Propionivibrio dicarboxylicus TaxID=83767 RepID=A0A1G8EP89_9RHOO|nr:energy transducer TonB [Propionivibrio dicarboxylicus]SDH71684.1 outer membrane transport energization protein TonB [Propionivibrio dicarboxylicus]